MTVLILGSPMAAADYHACQAILKETPPGSALERLILRKLRHATPAADSDIDPLLVTISSRVEFQIDDEAPQTRILVRNGFRNGLVGLTLLITTARGMAMLGLRAGQSFAFDENGRTRTVTVRNVPYQPQAARLGRRPAARTGNASADVVSLQTAREDRDHAPAWDAAIRRKGT
ncbi:hypothetical protein ABUE31_01980 [Mesorhizobium sp. ZMM04-5]|uniref:Nucleoside-diphosphate kinase n=1 Tax=Mesorhizobium marinum TaxID=3228790 RepID=A0ABV3QUK7_9HYPH